MAIGYQHTPRLPDWPGVKQYPGRVLHSAGYRNPKEFRGADVLVVGSGCSGMEIANDLAQGGAARVRVSVRSQPNLVLRSWGWLPDDILIKPLFRLPPRKADSVMRFMRRWLIGDLAPYGLVSPDDGVFTGYVSKVDPSVVDMETVLALRARRIEVVSGVKSVDRGGVQLDDDTVIQPDAIVAATGYTSGLEPIVGHLGVLNDGGLPYLRGGPAAQPGLRFMGYDSLIQNFYREACRVAEGIDQELAQPSRAQLSLS
jgi:NADPH-dependent 2,4-dienoyl-CoA reductase/sulfur reductase-like enzyme